MTKRIPLKEIITKAIDKRYELFEALGKKAKALDKEKDPAKLDAIHIEMRELVLDMECMEKYVLNKHPEATPLWYALRDLTFEEGCEENIQKGRNSRMA